MPRSFADAGRMLTLLFSVGCLLLVQPAAALAQITPDGSMGRSGPLTGPAYTIGADLGQVRGANLFHSFGQFNILKGESATFTGPNTIQNILSRVTGAPSSIDGLLRSTIPGANVFLLNPKGVFFGPNASLDVSGSFHVSTADYIGFADGTKFHADLTRATTLTVAPPAAFGFLTASPAGISFDGSVLRVGRGATLSVLGGDVTLTQSALLAPSGRINLVSVASVGEIQIAPDGTDIGVQGVGRLGRIRISGGEGGDQFPEAECDNLPCVATTGDGGGSVFIRAGSLAINEADVFSDNSGSVRGARLGIDIDVTGDIVVVGRGITADPRGSGDAGDIRIVAGQNVELRSTAGISSSSARSSISGNPGNIQIQTRTLTVSGSQISTATAGPSRGGSIQIVATDSVSVEEGGKITTNSGGLGAFGRAGNIDISTQRLVLSGNESRIDSGTFGPGMGGIITARATELVELRGGSLIVSESRRPPASSPDIERGPAGTIHIDTRTLSILEGSRIASSTSTRGDGGTVTVTASDSLFLTGRDTRNNPSQISSGTSRTVSVKDVSGADQDVTVFGDGRAGNITVGTGRLVIGLGGEISSGTSGAGAGGTVSLTVENALILAEGSRISADTTGIGGAGDVIIRVGTGAGKGTVSLRDGGQIVTSSKTPISGPGGSLRLIGTGPISIAGRGSDGQPSGLLSSTASSQAAGQVTVSAPALTLGGGGQISASTTSGGQAGDILLAVGNLSLTGDAVVASRTSGGGRGGSVTVRDANAMSLSSGQISTDATGLGAGGSIDISALRIRLAQGAQISATSTGLGNAGDITIRVPLSFESRNSTVTAAANGADGGNITLQVGSLARLIDSRITATVQGGEGQGGNIVISGLSEILDEPALVRFANGEPRVRGGLLPRSPFVILENSEVRADAFGGPGGRVDIAADVFLNSNSIVSASSALGVPGTVDINAPTTDVSGSLARLPESILQAATLLRESCGARFTEHKTSSLAMGGRDRVPTEPGSATSSPLPSHELTAGEPVPTAMARAAPRLPIIELRCTK